jgi:hypothetical protein
LELDFQLCRLRFTLLALRACGCHKHLP